MALRYCISPFLLLVLLCVICTQQAMAQGAGHQREWRERLTPVQRQQVETLINEARPRIQELRQQVKDKVLELQAFSYTQDTDPEVLPRLGRELQSLRDALHAEILALEERIHQATGITMRGRRGRGCAELSRSRF